MDTIDSGVGNRSIIIFLVKCMSLNSKSNIYLHFFPQTARLTIYFSLISLKIDLMYNVKIHATFLRKTHKM